MSEPLHCCFYSRLPTFAICLFQSSGGFMAHGGSDMLVHELGEVQINLHQNCTENKLIVINMQQQFQSLTLNMAKHILDKK